MKINKLNKKGFTLIELLAVVVILAIVMGISGSSVINSMNRARRNSLLSAAQNAANTINEWYAEDQLTSTTSEKKLGDTFIDNSSSTGTDANLDNWTCFGSTSTSGGTTTTTYTQISNNGHSTALYLALNLNENDFVLTGTKPSSAAAAISQNTCSAYRYSSVSGAYEILLVAKKGGKYYVNADKESDKNFAYDKASAYATKLTY